MMPLILFGTFFLLIFVNTPISIGLGVSAVLGMVYMGFDTADTAPLLYSSIAKFTLLAVPFFILAGLIMERAGISARLIRVAEVFLGKKRAGFAIIAVVVSCFFAAISGSGPATVAAVGTTMIPAMINKGYGKKIPSALMAASGSIGIIIPPSIGFVVYAVIAEVSMTRLFLAGFIPGIIMGACYIGCSTWLLRDNKEIEVDETIYTAKDKLLAIRDALWGIFTPVIILGGIYGGFFTPTEAAGVAVVYALFVGIFVYKTLRIKDLYELMVESAITSALSMFIVACASIFAWLLTTSLVAKNLALAMLSLSSNKYILLLIMNVLFLIAGCFLDTISAYYILVPLMLPIIIQIGYDPIAFGVFLTVNLAIGQFTPPVGANLYIACNLADTSLKEIVPTAVPYMIAGIVGLLIITLFPQVSTFLPNLLMG